ncbi:NADH dehydrogenase ubiquinone 1 alpha subcomplex subunit 6 [Taenia crassiceps]|uniref:NADH dehydrogenase [ubiquinone] 1 alpha subcomplex subunit 6 n=1 Tax=Taenia crassiceps TaxID=6207 RepID=A0ABR4QMI8_9CEST
MSVAGGFKVARPILSRNSVEAKRRVLNLYRAWYRQLPFIVKEYGYTYVTATLPQLKQKLREEFMKNKDVKDIRVVDLLGQNDLLEVARIWRSDCQVMDFFRETAAEKPKDFLAKFLSGR